MDDHRNYHAVKMLSPSIFIEMKVASAVGCGSHGDAPPG
jgi:hypothetical protein